MEFSVKEEKGFKYVEEGAGEPLVLLHGLMGNLHNWDAVINEFKDRYRVIIPLLPIYDLPLLSTGVKGLAKHLDKFLKYKNIDSVLLLGNSLGGHVGLVYTLKHLDKVKGLVLSGSSGLYENAFGGTFPKRGDYDFIKEKVEFTFFDPATATKELVDEVYSAVNDRHKVIRILAMAKSAIRHNMAKELKHIKLPVCLIWGKNDVVTPPDVALEFKLLLPDAELNWIEQCGHAPMMERPEQFNQFVNKFIDKIKY